VTLNVAVIAVDMNFTVMAESWHDQRRYTHIAIEALGSHPVVADIKDELDKVSPHWPNLDSE